MNKILIYLVLLNITILEAGSLSDALSNAKVDGYIRGTYQTHDIKNDKVHKDDALGGKVHIETLPFAGFSLGISLYSSNALFNNDNSVLSTLRGESEKSYSLVGEGYIQTQFGKSLIKVGRQELDTPFADRDDVGMIPNTFEAGVLINKELANTTIFLAQIRKMAGSGAEIIDEFRKVNNNDYVNLLGLTYGAEEGSNVSAWYYQLKNAEVEKIFYTQASYLENVSGLFYEIAVQYAKEEYKVGEDAVVKGGSFALIDKGLRLSTAYTKVTGNQAFSGFGGGPFLSNAEFLIIDNAGADAKAIRYGVEWQSSKNLTFGLSKLTLTTKEDKEATEMDVLVNYDISENMEMHLIYSKIDASVLGENDANHLRIFANYNF